MPISRPDTIPKVINFIWGQNPKSILDVGVGFGGMGVLFRQTCDIRWGRLQQWTTIIHGIEGFVKYHNPIWTTIYNKVFIGEAIEQIQQLTEKYDIVFLGDVLEHFEKEKAKELLDLAIKRANRFVIATTPNTFAANKDEVARFGNAYEEHKCLLEDKDFPECSEIELCGNQKLIIIDVKKIDNKKDNKFNEDDLC